MKWYNALGIVIFFYAIYILFVFLRFLECNMPFALQMWFYLIGIIPFSPLSPTFNCNFCFEFAAIILIIINMFFYANNWIFFIHVSIRHIFYGQSFILGCRTQRLFVFSSNGDGLLLFSSREIDLDLDCCSFLFSLYTVLCLYWTILSLYKLWMTVSTRFLLIAFNVISFVT